MNDSWGTVGSMAMEDWPPPIAKGLPRVQEKLTEYFYPTSENQQQLLKAFFFLPNSNQIKSGAVG